MSLREALRLGVLALTIPPILGFAGAPKVRKSPRRHSLRKFPDPDLPPVSRRQRPLLCMHGRALRLHRME